MSDSTQAFSMYPRKRIRYLLLTFAPVYILYFVLYATPAGAAAAQHEGLPRTLVLLSLLPVCILGYFLIFKKNHHIEVNGTTVTDTNAMLQKTGSFSIRAVRRVTRNLLGELRLWDENGKKLLTVEAGMANFDKFEVFLRENHIERD